MLNISNCNTNLKLIWNNLKVKVYNFTNYHFKNVKKMFIDKRF